MSSPATRAKIGSSQQSSAIEHSIFKRFVLCGNKLKYSPVSKYGIVDVW